MSLSLVAYKAAQRLARMTGLNLAVQREATNRTGHEWTCDIDKNLTGNSPQKVLTTDKTHAIIIA